MKYYAASQGNDTYPDSDNNAEGAYLLKPAMWNRFQYAYSRLETAETIQTMNYLTQWTFKYVSYLTQEFAIVNVKFFPGFSESIEFDVELDGVSVMRDNQGKDVTVNWIFDNFTANSTFWTDSNGLEMQERHLNYRPTWNYSGDQNISANYYPVNSGIAMRSITPENSTRQVTVINERSTGGSADLSFKGGIELIHNRRLLKDDNRGVGEPLNETDALGFGMRVNSRYWLQIIDYNTTRSGQRQQQLLVDLPLQYFFAFNYSAS